MKLILSSKAFGNPRVTEKISAELRQNINTIKVLLIPTALGGIYPPDKYINELLNAGFNKNNIIIFDENYCDDFRNLNIDAIYVCGGNTFTLLKNISECDFGPEIVKYLNKGVIYIGRSAGTHLVTRNIEHVLPFDENTIGLKDFDALRLFDGIVFCHYNNEREKYYNEAVNKGLYTVYRITDEEIIVSENGNNLIK